jgi:ankyrin repeat protein
MYDAAALFESITSGDQSRLQALLAADPSLASARNERGQSAVLLAQYRHRREMVELLLAAGPDLDIFAAAAVGRRDRVDELLDDEPILLAATGPDGFTPLHLAAYFGWDDTVQLLLVRGANVRAVAQNALRVQPLHSALAGGHVGVAELLVEAGADVNARQGGGWTPLHAAVRNRSEEAVHLLVTSGADPMRPADDGTTARDLAERGKMSAIMEVLRRSIHESGSGEG